MSITDELRRIAAKTECANGRCEKLYRGDLDHIADRIDAEHAKAVERAYGDGAMSVPIALDESQWVKLPVDADGVPIRVGDELTNGEDLPAKVLCMVLDESGWMVSTRELRGHGVPPATLRHVQPDSWVRIIGDAMSFDGDGWYSTRDDAMAELVERCRRLAGERG